MAIHKPVLLQETIESLSLLAGTTAVDGTLGSGGHAQEIIKRISPGGTFIGIDVDEKALLRNRAMFEPIAKELSVQTHFIKDNFRNLKEILLTTGVVDVNAILLDLGFSSEQISESGRGFSFLRDEPLLMTLSGDASYTAIDLINSASPEELEEILRNYGEEQFARNISQEIVKRRRETPITKTFELVETVKAATPLWYHRRKIHPATKTFQAIRIAVNDELGALRDFLSQMPAVVAHKGRLAIISFHSGEDRIVKLQFVAWERSGVGKRVNKKAIKPTREEVLVNRRARSAKLRVCEFI
ncbi:MAG TPA: 16S rRNA (cytosine(1402)-N(4))-methyltransferase RsmH [Candidatus Paceibacterota bacterium]